MSLEFIVTRDPGLLGQYYTLREQCFRRELGLPRFDGGEEDRDTQGQILLAVAGGQCIGGARISAQVTLPSQANQLQLERDACCMWERFVIDPAVRTVQLVREFCGHLVVASADNGYEHAMVLSSLRNARFYRRCLWAVGVDFQIHRPVPHCAQGAFAGLEHYLSVARVGETQPLSAAI